MPQITHVDAKKEDVVLLVGIIYFQVREGWLAPALT